ncbi:MAG: type B 50S ribosomal protein L31 [Planctomycetota bacterium]|jgi:large subunit ribosomal protein L31|nr:type B 50S ribosomal protein L31 [Planctomycetota bacterium]
MKAEIHPEIREVIFKDGIEGNLFKIRSSVPSKETIDIDGVEYPLVRCDVTSASHPFYTGQQRILDTTGRVEKFGNKFGSGFSKMAKRKKKA